MAGWRTKSQVKDMESKEMPLPTLSPAVPAFVKLGLTVAYTVFYSLLFVFVYVQLWLILRYRHKRFSYQTVFLFLCLLWAALRTILFSFYFEDFVQANSLGPFAFWLLYCFPVCLQFFTLSLMNLYFTQVIFKAKSKYCPELQKYRLPLQLIFLLASLLFLVVNLTCALLVKIMHSETKTIVFVRVAINDTLFVLCAISLSVSLYKIAKMSLANIYLESKGTSLCQIVVVGVLIILLYTSRACYNLVAITLTSYNHINMFDYDWYKVSDQTGNGISCSHGFTSRAFFFDNPRRYDSDEDLAWTAACHSALSSSSSISQINDYYGTKNQSYNYEEFASFASDAQVSIHAEIHPQNSPTLLT
ncbi:G protein-coupled receptor 137Ba isoform X2 [Carcharodon carcharias]|uniref:G protein-coupled receptor 137Ba isoform X2 n=1 Tax=Carcharodon carcharias TaxID=13397 RepID=UPI001B7DD6A0|nr:G protein-coupled receptor 137Ba isoform X2 [Carcharodon carcharias]